MDELAKKKKIERSQYMEEVKRWGTTFLGIEQRHTYWLYKVIDEILNENKVEGIIELGTGKGALSIFLSLNCFERGYKPLLTYDIKKMTDTKLFDLLKVKYVIGDIFSQQLIQEIKEYADVPIFLMCDNGDKPKEFNTFVPYLKKGSIIAAHDFHDRYKYIKKGLGIRTKQVKDTITEYSLKPIKQKDWDSPPDYIKTMFYKVM